MKAICLIAARGGSKGVPKKNSRIFVGKPLITHAIESALKSKIFSKVIVSTDDKTIAEIARKHGAEVPGLRPKKLATSNASMEDVLFHIIKKMEKNGEKFDIILNRDCTAPFIRISDMKKSIKFRKQKMRLIRYCKLKNEIFGRFDIYYFYLKKKKTGIRQ